MANASLHRTNEFKLFCPSYKICSMLQRINLSHHALLLNVVTRENSRCDDYLAAISGFKLFIICGCGCGCEVDDIRPIRHHIY